MIHLRSIFAIVRKDILDILFNKATGIMLLTPVMLSILFAGLSGLLVGQSDKLLIYNPQHSGLGQLVNSQATEWERQRVVTIITDYASGESHALPSVIITPTTSLPTTSIYTIDLSTFFEALALLTSISVGISLVSTLLVEEKEKRTLRLLLVSPATITDVALAKLLVGVAYQIILSIVVLAVMHGFVGKLPLVLLFVLLSSCFGLALSLLAGSIFHTTSGLGRFLGVVSLLFIIPTVFASPLGAISPMPRWLPSCICCRPITWPVA